MENRMFSHYWENHYLLMGKSLPINGNSFRINGTSFLITINGKWFPINGSWFPINGNSDFVFPINGKWFLINGKWISNNGKWIPICGKYWFFAGIECHSITTETYIAQLHITEWRIMHGSCTSGIVLWSSHDKERKWAKWVMRSYSGRDRLVPVLWATPRQKSGVRVWCWYRELSCNMAVQLGGLVHEAHNLTWVHNMGSYLTTTKAQLYWSVINTV